MSSDERCGTQAGWGRHQSRGEKPCPPCKAAKAEYDKRWRESGDTAKRNRANARAQRLANRDLARIYREEYSRLYAAHKQQVFRELGLS